MYIPLLMKMKKTILLSTLMLLSLTALADNEAKQTVKINGETIDKTVSKITFDGDNVVLTFADQTSQTADMEQVSISFFYQTNGVEVLKTISPNTLEGKKIFNLQGQIVNQVSKGVYIVDGKKIIIR